ncbi:MAG: hypothetical protein ACI9VR_004930 [Cognaticolwellia sp.]|jgi:hypothetical protein
MKKLILSVLCLSPLMACESVSSSDVLTSGMYANLEVSADGSGSSRANAVLRVGGASSNVYVDLVDGDTLTVEQGGETVELEKSSVGEFRDYNADFDVDVVDTEFDFAFLRDVDDGAPSSVISLPAQFEITGPEADATISRAEDLTFTWDGGSDDSMRYSMDGDCVFSEGETLEGDEGTYTIPGGVIESLDENEPETCTMELVLRRARSSAVDDGFGEGGTAEGVQVRRLKIVSAP